MLETFINDGVVTVTQHDSQTRKVAQTQEQHEAPVLMNAVGQKPKHALVENDLAPAFEG